MTLYEFTVILSDVDVLTAEAADALYTAFDDGTAGSCNGVVSIEFHREASSLREAILSAITDVEKANFKAARVETEDSRILSEINTSLEKAVSS
jgi:2C-methyl-D-erythritol 2,4-cyclodiphosphate synthase